MSSLAGKHGLIVGVANKRSISWAIAQAAAAAGARLALTYPSARLEENVRDLAAKLENPLVLPCDVSSDEQIAALGETLDREFGGLDFLVHGAAFAPAEALSNPFVETSRESFRIALDVSAYSLIGLTRAVAPLMARRGGGSILTLTYIGSQRVFTNYNVMGVAKAALESSVRYLAADLGPQNIRVNAISAGADQDARRGRHLGLLEHPAGLPRSCAAAARSGSERGRRHRGVPARTRRSRHHRRNHHGRRRLSRRRHLIPTFRLSDRREFPFLDP